jgi:hypothetical protein
MIPQKNISRISNMTCVQGKKRIPENVIERDYCLSWFLFGLGQSSLREVLVFKGGTALRRCYFKDYRFSEDLDFTLLTKISLMQIFAELNKIFEWVKRESGIEFSLGKVEEVHLNTHTFYMDYNGPLQGGTRSAKVDITIIEKLMFPVVEKSLIRSYEEYTDFPEELTILVYSIEEIMIEKICALLTRARNEPRDLFDIYCLITEKDIDLEQLVYSLQSKMEFKGLAPEESATAFDRKEKLLKKMWKTRLGYQMGELPEFDNIFRTVKRAFRQAGII